METIQKTLVLLSEPVRLRIVHLLYRLDRSLSVGAIVDALGLPQSTVSRHLAILRDSGLLGFEAVGTRRVYFLNDNQSPLQRGLLAALEPSVRGSAEAMMDLERADLTESTKHATKSLHNANEEIPDFSSIFKALGHRKRTMIINAIRIYPGASLGTIAKQIGSSRQTTRRHLSTLEAADLVHPKSSGRTRRHFYNPVPLQQVHQHLVDQFSETMSSYLISIKEQIEGGKS